MTDLIFYPRRIFPDFHFRVFNFFDFSFLLGPNLGQMTLLSYLFFQSLFLFLYHFLLKYYLTLPLLKLSHFQEIITLCRLTESNLSWNCPVLRKILPNIDWPNLTFVRISKVVEVSSTFLWFSYKFFVWMPTFQISNHQICHIFYNFFVWMQTFQISISH